MTTTTLADDLLTVLLARHSANETVRSALTTLRIAVQMAHDETRNDDLIDASINALLAARYTPTSLTKDSHDAAAALMTHARQDVEALADTRTASNDVAEVRHSVDNIVAIAADLTRQSRSLFADE